MIGLETVYKYHHRSRGKDFAVLAKLRGSFLKKHVGVGKIVLDIGCRDGELTSMYAEGNRVTGVDVDSSALSRAKNKIPDISVVHTDLNGEWHFTKEAYDVVVACEFLEHIYFPDLVMDKIRYVLKPGGIFVGTIPHAYSIQSRIKFLFGIKTGTPLQDPTHINHFLYKDFKRSMEEKFQMIEITGYVPSRYSIVSIFNTFLFADTIMFCVKKKENQ